MQKVLVPDMLLGYAVNVIAFIYYKIVIILLPIN